MQAVLCGYSLAGTYKWKKSLSIFMQICIVHFFLTNAGLPLYAKLTWKAPFTRTWCLSARKGPVSIRPLQERASSITVSVNIVSPHLPIGSLCFGLQHLCFQTCVLTGPHLALLSDIPLPKRIKQISTLHAASILNCFWSKTYFSRSLSSVPPGFSLLWCVFYILFLFFQDVLRNMLSDFMHLEYEKCAVIYYIKKIKLCL